MNERDEKELDRLLGAMPSPEAPPWFKQRTLNRLREEQSSGFRLSLSRWWAGFLGRGPRLVSLTAISAVLVVGFTLYFGGESNPVDPSAHASLDSALDAFVSYTEENSDWGGDPFL